MEDWDVDEIVDGELIRLGVYLISEFRECLNLHIKEGTAARRRVSYWGMGS